ncbi:ATP-dependent Clp protease ATP-binding subunit [bacterium D16-54]|nr:ATP-dependent Clp protease ATP-binding subunit [bacterium D16-54]RKJ14557.1 ATP-dependent Clp protease ATP-binding subunit [bacterium D16-56]
MIDNVIVFTGSKKDFNKLLEERIDRENDEVVTFMELIQHYNARLHPTESGVKEIFLKKKIGANCVVCKADDFGSVLEHTLSNFTQIINLNYDVENLFVHNPPKLVLNSLRTEFGDDIEYLKSEYAKINVDILKRIFRNLNENILGQEQCKKQLITGLYRLTKEKSEKPAVFMLYGPSGVGKTETAKSISRSLGGELLRIQFSMMQTQEAYNYVFGAEHSKTSFARDMLSRESNVILIDEFDKVNSTFYNAFYELFDEGRYVDTNYEVDLRHTIFLCTSNFMSDKEIKNALGPAMYSRIGSCIEYGELDKDQKIVIINKWFSEITDILDEDERKVISNTDIQKWFIEHAGRYDNIRTLKTKMELAIFEKLAEVFIMNAD